MVDTENLEDSAVIGVTATILVIASLLAVYMLVRNFTSYNYPSAQKYLFFVYSEPILIGWCAWVELLNHDTSRGLEFLMNLFKAICVACFFLYLESMLGKVHIEGKINYSDEHKLQILCAATKPTSLVCCKVRPFPSTERSKKVLRTIRIFVFLSVGMEIFTAIAGGIAILAMGSSATDSSGFQSGTNILSGLKSFTSGLALGFLMILSMYCEKIPMIHHLMIFLKMNILQAWVFCTDVQPLIIQIFATKDLIADTNIYSSQEITTYTNALLLVTEMILITFLMAISFPTSDFTRDYYGDDTYPALNSNGENKVIP